MENQKKIEKEKTFIIYPTHRELGYTAPGIAIQAKEYSVAVNLAKVQSGLARFEDKWLFM
jgi:hypothetical protein